MPDPTEQGTLRQIPSVRDWLSAIVAIVGLGLTLVTVGRWQGQIEAKLSAIETRLTSIDQAVSPVADKFYTQSLEHQRLEGRVKALEAWRDNTKR